MYIKIFFSNKTMGWTTAANNSEPWLTVEAGGEPVCVLWPSIHRFSWCTPTMGDSLDLCSIKHDSQQQRLIALPWFYFHPPPSRSRCIGRCWWAGFTAHSSCGRWDPWSADAFSVGISRGKEAVWSWRPRVSSYGRTRRESLWRLLGKCRRRVFLTWAQCNVANSR